MERNSASALTPIKTLSKFFLLTSLYFFPLLRTASLLYVLMTLLSWGAPPLFAEDRARPLRVVRGEIIDFFGNGRPAQVRFEVFGPSFRKGLVVLKVSSRNRVYLRRAWSTSSYYARGKAIQSPEEVYRSWEESIRAAPSVAVVWHYRSDYGLSEETTTQRLKALRATIRAADVLKEFESEPRRRALVFWSDKSYTTVYVYVKALDRVIQLAEVQ